MLFELRRLYRFDNILHESTIIFCSFRNHSYLFNLKYEERYFTLITRNEGLLNYNHEQLTRFDVLRIFHTESLHFEFQTKTYYAYHAKSFPIEYETRVHVFNLEQAKEKGREESCARGGVKLL